GLDPFIPITLEQRHVLESGRMEYDLRPEFGGETEDPIAVANVRQTAFNRRVRLLGRERFQDRVQGGLRVLDHEDAGRTECNDAIANLGADGPAPTGHDDRLAAHEILQPAVVNLHAGPQQQVLDIDRGKAQRLAVFIEGGQTASG